jgi:electron transport complex protein RnfG
MAKLESSFKNMVLVLTSITLFAAVALGSVYKLTKEPIEASKKAKQENAIKEVLPPFDRLDEVEVVNIEGLDDPFYVNKAYLGDEFVGAAVQSYSKSAFSGEIKVMVGFDKDGNIFNYSVLEQKETPGLGTKMVDWFKTEKGNQDIRGLNGATNNLTVSKAGGEVDAITAATISSNAFLESVRFAYSAYSQNYDGLTGATSVKADSTQTN